MKNCLVIDKAPGSGITGKIVRLIKFISNSIINIDDISNIYIISECNVNNMNCIFEPFIKIPDIQLTLINGSDGTNINLKNIFKNPDFVKLSKIAKLIRFNMSVITPLLINKEEEILYDLGIHIRLTDMNSHHGKAYGNVYYENYRKIISDFLNKTKIDNIFLASDNFESKETTIKFLLDYGFTTHNIHYNNNELLSINEKNESFTTFQISNFGNPAFFIEVLKDVFNLSKSNNLIYRTSNVSNLAILLSNTLSSKSVTLI